MRTKIPPLISKHLSSFIGYFRLNFFILTGLLLVLNCQHDDFINNTSQQEQHSKTVIPFEYYSKTYSELSNELKFNEAFNKFFKKDKLNTTDNSKTVMEEQYGFTIDSSVIKEISSDNYTSYTFLIKREIEDDSFFENLIISIDSTAIPEAYIIKYTLNSEPIYIEEDDAYTLDAETELTQIDYNVSEAKVIYTEPDGCTVVTLMCSFEYNHPAGDGCLIHRQPEEFWLSYDTSACYDTSNGGTGGGGVGDGTPPSGGSPSGGTTGGNGGILTDPNMPACKGPDCPEEFDEELLSDCNVLNQLSQSPDFITKMNELKTATAGNIEISYLGITNSNGNTTFPSAYRDQGQPNSNDVPLKIPASPINVMLHNHATLTTTPIVGNGSLSVQSPSDLNGIWHFYENNYITNLDNFVSVVITPDQTVYALTINWPSDFQTNGGKFLKTLRAAEAFYANKITLGKTNDLNETAFAERLKELNMGITLYRGNFNQVQGDAPFTKWTRIKIQNDGTKKDRNCN